MKARNRLFSLATYLNEISNPFAKYPIDSDRDIIFYAAQKNDNQLLKVNLSLFHPI